MDKITLYISELNLRGGTHKQALQFLSVANQIGVETDLITPIYQSNTTFSEFRKHKITFIFQRLLFSDNKVLSRIQHAFAQILCGIRFDRRNLCFIHDNKCYFFILILLLRGIKFTWQINDPDSSFASGINSRRTVRFQRLRKSIATIIARKADAIFVNVTKNKKVIFDATGVEAMVFYCGVEKNPPQIQKQHACSIATKQHLNILSIGVVQPHRNYIRLINSLDLLGEAENLTLNIVGSTESDPAYTNKVLETAARSSSEVNLLGNVSESELSALFKTADIFVFVNEDQSWGLSIFEAISYLKPVLVSKTVGALELISDFETVFTVDEKDEADIAAGLDRLILKMSDCPTSKLQLAADDVDKMTWESMYVRPVLSNLGFIHD